MRVWIVSLLLVACSQKGEPIPFGSDRPREAEPEPECPGVAALCYGGCSAEGKIVEPTCSAGTWRCPENSAQLEHCAAFECTRSQSICCTWQGEPLTAVCDRTGQLPVCPPHSLISNKSALCTVTAEHCRVDSPKALHGMACQPDTASCAIGVGCGTCICDCGADSGRWSCQCPEC